MKRRLAKRSGLTAIEYAMILAALCLGCLTVITYVGQSTAHDILPPPTHNAAVDADKIDRDSIRAEAISAESGRAEATATRGQKGEPGDLDGAPQSSPSNG